RPGVPDDRVLVVVQLGGGNDGLNTVIPYSQDAYYRARPTLVVPQTGVLRINDDVGLHPSLAKVMDLHEQDAMAVIQGVGYPDPSRSHFKSMAIWQTADPDGRVLRHTAMNAYVSSAQVPEAARGYRGGVEYPNSQFAASLRLIAQMIAGKLPTKVYYAHMTGFDTHASQRGAHENLLAQFAAGVSAFFKDL